VITGSFSALVVRERARDREAELTGARKRLAMEAVLAERTGAAAVTAEPASLRASAKVQARERGAEALQSSGLESTGCTASLPLERAAGEEIGSAPCVGSRLEAALRDKENDSIEGAGGAESIALVCAAG